ncbi:4-methyl-5(B-hydroxyethyl)-thiazole monophosphate biosynthesis protein [Candidatus Thiomargarita nelsonii]|uniref:4-methyl-5(B-hydroxyethyl)-thiazole monophosphate biosynthesis protein n=1 Tax=Candidatus Thiomargarita nelsonii TaxID=1003181 RepID=A0A0A6RV29_9GAMM|nr:4-methyl-5(B-hydroxyethyl)-thiazole monophosphate biosynthesis protein [Candidatus Thiomargarita nelsonii]
MPTVLIPLAQGCEELEAVTVIDLLRRAGISVLTAGLDNQAVKASRGVVLIPDTTLDDAIKQSFDMIVLPGGLAGAENLNNDPRIHQLLKDMQQQGKYTAAICAAPKVLADAGLLANKSATSYPGVLESMPDMQIIDAPVVKDGQVVTSRGPGTAMDFALELIEILVGRDSRDNVEAGLVRSV